MAKQKSTTRGRDKSSTPKTNIRASGSNTSKGSKTTTSGTKMKWKEWVEKWSMTSLKIKTPFLEMYWEPKDQDKNAAWEMYIELLTRITTQSLPAEHGDEATALESIHKLFGLTREVIKRHERHCITFTKIAIIILNQKIRPFTAKWHKEMLADAFNDSKKCDNFRQELTELQIILKNYTKMLADMADVEDLTELEEE